MFTRTFLAVAAVLALVACSGGPAATTPAASPTAAATTAAPAPSSALEKTTLRLAYSGGLDFSKGTFYKLEKDLRAMGLTVEVNVFNSSQDAFRAVVAGEADMAEGAILSAISLAQQQGGGVKVIVADEQVPDYLLISRPDFASLDQLEGARVGISTPGDTSDTLTRLVFGREGIDVDAVQWIQIGGTGARMAGLLADQIDAGLAHAAEGLNAATEGGLNMLHRVADTVPDYLQRGLITTDEFIADNPILTQLVVDTLIDAARWAQTNKDEYIELSREVVPDLSEEARDQAWEIYHDIRKHAVDGGLTVEQIQNTIAIEQEVGNLEGEVPELSTFIDASFVESYLERNGEFEE
jgi:NitT/TauT family transport system substrate-binding protein